MKSFERLQRLTTTGQQRKSGTITAADNGLYQVATDAGEVIRAEAQPGYVVGQRVSIISGRIVGLVGNSAAVETVRA